MKRKDAAPSMEDILEYHGSTTIQRTRRTGNAVIWRDWILFDTVEEAQAFYHDHR
ncbi:MAG: hypothetical protein JEZ11_06015 [Desulfobacterales bacterium]|nr:hypothetical protein [Desulfobacterales bacterium]